MDVDLRATKNLRESAVARSVLGPIMQAPWWPARRWSVRNWSVSPNFYPERTVVSPSRNYRVPLC